MVKGDKDKIRKYSRKTESTSSKNNFLSSGPHTMCYSSTLTHSPVHIRDRWIRKPTRNAFLMFKLFLLNLFSYLRITLLPTKRHGPLGLYRVWPIRLYGCGISKWEMWSNLCVFSCSFIFPTKNHSAKHAPTQTHTRLREHKIVVCAWLNAMITYNVVSVCVGAALEMNHSPMGRGVVLLINLCLVIMSVRMCCVRILFAKKICVGHCLPACRPDYLLCIIL